MSDVMTSLAVLGEYFGGIIANLVLTYSGSLSLWSLGVALLVAAMFTIWKRWPKRKSFRLRALLRLLFPRRVWLSASAKADYGFVLFNSLMVGVLFGWAVLTFNQVSIWTSTLLTGAFGPMAATEMSAVVTTTLMTVALFVAYEFGYWVDHYLKHRIPVLWEFHKVHHQAEVLTPMTNFRMHPFDSIVFYNITALSTGMANGLLSFAFGKPLGAFTIEGANLILVAFTYVTLHLQHTHMWIPFTGWLGRVLLSPAHHQIHHSMNPIHFDRNFGGCLSLFDWVFGTLHLPTKDRQKIKFGVEPEAGDPHSITGGLITPVVRALSLLRPRWSQGLVTPAKSSKA